MHGEPGLRFRVPAPIALDLRGPECAIGPWDMPAFWASMPEATVHEHGNSLVREKEVRASRHVLPVQLPAPDACPDHAQAQAQLRCLVALALHSGHCAGPYRGHVRERPAWKLRPKGFLHF